MQKNTKNSEENKNTQWNIIKKSLLKFDKNEYINLIKDLHELSKSNKNFIESKLLPGNDTTLYKYKDQIRNYISPKEPWKESQKIDLNNARKIINQYKKATGINLNLVELMVHYVECGTNFLLEYGDMYESYYSSLESVFKNALDTMKQFEISEVQIFIRRLEKIIKIAEDEIGWGYYDVISELFQKAYGKH